MKQWKSFTLGATVFAISALSVNMAQAMVDTHAVKQDKKQKSAPEAVEGEFIVKLKTGVLSVQAFNRQLSAMGMKVVETVHASSSVQRVKVVKPELLLKKLGAATLSATSLQQATIQSLTSFSGVEFAEPNFIYRVMDLPTSIPNDPKFVNLWGMNNGGQADSTGRAGKVGADIKATQAWAIEKGSKNIVVAVIDTGVDYTHPDLVNNIWTKPGTTNVHGYNAITGALNPMDDHSHGTHCAGTIGGEGDNGIGVTGVTWNVSIMGVKFLSATGGGSLGDAIKAIDWAADNGAHIMSNSWGGGGFSQALLDAIQRASDKGILFIAAAGNDGASNDSSPAYPASYQIENVVSVAASNNLDAMSSFSNFGKTSVHLIAPGENIVSSIVGGGYQSFSGTSMATPHVSGAASLLLTKEPSLTPAQVRERLMQTSDKIKAFRTKLVSGGRLNLYNLITNTIPPGFVVIPDSAWSLPIANAINTKSPYDANTTQRWEIKQDGAKFMRLHFESFKTEARYDVLRIKDKDGNIAEEYSGNLGADFWTPEVEGDTIVLEFSSDSTIQSDGFKIDSFSWTDFTGATSVSKIK